ncbi:hypothetical protein G6F35_015512 [Rhizopus arrhizus]|nr:hypothetical protein G6F35_015512 [Rhizopus arrhizus]
MHQEAAVAREADDGLVGPDTLGADGGRQAVAHRARGGRQLRAETGEAVKAVQPGSVVARAVGHDGIGRQRLFQVGHDLAHLQRAWGGDGFRVAPLQVRLAHGLGAFGPHGLGRRLQAGQRCREGGRRRVDGKGGAVHAAQLGGVGMHVHQLLLGHRDVQQRVGLAGVFRHAAADQQDQVRIGHALEQRRVDAQAHVADEARVVRRE